MYFVHIVRQIAAAGREVGCGPPAHARAPMLKRFPPAQEYTDLVNQLDFQDFYKREMDKRQRMQKEQQGEQTEARPRPPARPA
jgi:hypothetical protein